MDNKTKRLARKWFESLKLTNEVMEYDDDRAEALTPEGYDSWIEQPVDPQEFLDGGLWIELPSGGRFYASDFEYVVSDAVISAIKDDIVKRLMGLNEARFPTGRQL